MESLYCSDLIAGLGVWLQLFLKIFFIYCFYILKIIFYTNASK
jgi:hypothetical protein